VFLARLICPYRCQFLPGCWAGAQENFDANLLWYDPPPQLTVPKHRYILCSTVLPPRSVPLPNKRRVRGNHHSGCD
jgi:hypothetical protein